MQIRNGTTAMLRHEIDTGKTGDKVAWPDPAMSPLGTDDEAAGTPPGQQRINLAREQELRAPDLLVPRLDGPTRFYVVFIIALGLLFLARGVFVAGPN